MIIGTNIANIPCGLIVKNFLYPSASMGLSSAKKVIRIPASSSQGVYEKWNLDFIVLKIPPKKRQKKTKKTIAVSIGTWPPDIFLLRNILKV